MRCQLTFSIRHVWISQSGYMQYDQMSCFDAVSTVTNLPVRDSRSALFSTHFAPNFAINSDSAIVIHSLNELQVDQHC